MPLKQLKFGVKPCLSLLVGLLRAGNLRGESEVDATKFAQLQILCGCNERKSAVRVKSHKKGEARAKDASHKEGIQKGLVCNARRRARGGTLFCSCFLA